MKKNIFVLLVLSLLLQSCSETDDMRFCPYSSWRIMYIYMAFVASICNYDVIRNWWWEFSLRFTPFAAPCMVRMVGWTLAPFVGEYLDQNTYFLETDFLRFACGFVGTVIVAHLINVKFGEDLECKLYCHIGYDYVETCFRCFTWAMLIYFIYLTAKSFNL